MPKLEVTVDDKTYTIITDDISDKDYVRVIQAGIEQLIRENDPVIVSHTTIIPKT